MRTLTYAAICIACFLSVNHSQAGLISSQTEAYIYNSGTVFNDIDSQGATINPLSSSISATKNGVLMSSSVSANWSDPVSVTVGIENSWDFSNISSSTSANYGFSSVDLFQYDFIANESALTVDYLLGLSGTDTFGAQPFSLELTDQTANSTQLSSIGTTGTGSKSFALAVGHQYSLTIHDNSNVSTTGYTRLVMTHTGSFEISGGFSTVPEPTSMALWGLGTLGFGALARRRRKQKLELPA